MGRKRRVDDARILSSARWAFLMEGSRVSTRAIARDVGIAESVLYQRFGSKEELFLAAIAPPRLTVEEVLGPRSTLDAVTSPSHGRTWLLGVARGLVQLCLEVLPVQWLMLGAGVANDERYRAWWRQDPTQSVISEIAARLELLRDRGVLDTPRPHEVARMLLAAARDVVFHEAVLPDIHPSTMQLEPLVEEVADVLWLGIAPRPRYSERRG